MDEGHDAVAGPDQVPERQLGPVGGQSLERRVAGLGEADAAPDPAGQRAYARMEEAPAQLLAPPRSASSGARSALRFSAIRPSQTRPRNRGS